MSRTIIDQTVHNNMFTTHVEKVQLKPLGEHQAASTHKKIWEKNTPYICENGIIANGNSTIINRHNVDCVLIMLRAFNLLELINLSVHFGLTHMVSWLCRVGFCSYICIIMCMQLYGILWYQL